MSRLHARRFGSGPLGGLNEKCGRFFGSIGNRKLNILAYFQLSERDSANCALFEPEFRAACHGRNHSRAVIPKNAGHVSELTIRGRVILSILKSRFAPLIRPPFVETPLLVAWRSIGKLLRLPIPMANSLDRRFARPILHQMHHGSSWTIGIGI